MEASVARRPNTDMETAAPVENRPNWGEIELSESYLVCSMFEEAASLASSVLKRLCDKESNDGTIEDIELNDMLESAGMVFVQSSKELGRTSEIMNELVQLYNSLAAIPVQVFLTGACFQMQEDPRGVRKLLEEFLSKWRFVDGQYYLLASLETSILYTKGCSNPFVLEVDAYLQVVELYVTLLTETLSATDLAVSWVEKAALPEQIRQELLRRVHSMQSSTVTSSHASTSAGTSTTSSERPSKILEAGKQKDVDNAAKQAILRYSGQQVRTFWWFRTLNLKFGNTRFAVSNGSILLTILMLLAYYFMRRKKYTITSILKGQARLIKKAVVDLWQLAFSYQVNPLAAVEPIQNATRATHSN